MAAKAVGAGEWNGWAWARAIYGLFFAATGAWILVSVTTRLLPAPAQLTRDAAAFMQALADARFIDPLLALSFILGGGLLLCYRTAPAGLVMLAPSLAIILFFHLFLTGQYLWGAFVAAWFLLLAWYYRRAFVDLWSYSHERVEKA
jgi:hypothetical protein